MCLIIDEDVIHLVFVTDDPDFAPIKKALTGNPRRARMLIGGELARRYQKTKLWNLVFELWKQGRARRVDDGKVDQEATQLKKSKACRSNDYYVLALARVGRVRLLCTHDGKLQQDFKNKTLIDKPPGKVFTKASHAPLIARFCRNA